MSIYRRGDTWWYDISINGKQYRGSCKTKDQQSALEVHDRLRAEVWRGKLIQDKKRRTVIEAIDRFLEEREHKKSYRDDIRIAAWWKAQFKTKHVSHLDEVTPDLVKEIRDAEVGKPGKFGPIKPATVNRRLAFLSAVVLTAAKEWLWLDSVPKFRMLHGETERRRYLEPNEIARLVEALPQPYADMAMFAVSTGLRRGNVFGMRWDQVNLARRTVRFPELVMKNGQPFSMPLNETAIAMIQKQFGKHEEYVFCRPDGEKLSDIPSKLWAKALAKAGLEDVRWHDLRHTWASLMRQAGVGLDNLQELGGWKSREMVQRYAHLNVDHLAPFASVIDGVLDGPKHSAARLSHSDLENENKTRLRAA